MAQSIDSASGQPIQPFSLTASKVQDVTLISNNTTTTGVGTAQAIGGFKTLRIEVWGTGTFTVQIQVNYSNGSGTYYPIQVTNLSTMTIVSSINTPGIYDIDISGFSNVQANITAISGGNVNSVGKWVA